MFKQDLFGYLRLRNNGFRHLFQTTMETASVPLAPGGRLTEFGTSNLETFLNELEVCQIDVTEDFKPELGDQAATLRSESAERDNKSRCLCSG
jgi:hypothetical protein